MTNNSPKIFCRKPQYPIVWYLSGVLCFIVQWWVLRDAVYTDHPSLIGTLFKGLAEGALLFSWYWLLSPRYRWWLQLPLWIVGLLFFANVLYFRVFKDLIPLSSVTMTDNFNSLFFRSSLALVKGSDFVLLLMPLCLTASYVFFFAKRVKSVRMSWKLRLSALAVCLLTWCLQQAIYINRHKHDPFVAINIDRGENGLKWGDAIEYQYFAPNFNSRANDLHTRGVIIFSLREAYRSTIVGTSPVVLAADQKEAIDSYLASQPTDYTLPEVFSERDSMNVVLIIVESLNSWVFDLKVNGEEITPNLNKMIKEPGSIFVREVEVETRDGGSSDGQLIYDTGLLPLERGAAAMSFPSQVYPSLATILSKNTSLQFIGDDRRVWNYESSSAQYGYGRLYDEADLVNAGIDPRLYGKDKAIFTYAADVLSGTPQPFLAEIITLSMHLPFREDSVERIVAFDASGHSSTFNDYITAVCFFDSQFGRFVDSLKKAGIYDNTIIFIASDHSVLVQDEGHQNGFGDYITFIAINAGESPEAFYGDVYQSDIFPTMLDIAGRGDSQWKGLGISLFASDYRKEASPDRRKTAQALSDLIIRGNYFTLNP